MLLGLEPSLNKHNLCSQLSLEEADWVEVLADHRLGIYNERDPGPILYSVTEYGTSVFSSRIIGKHTPSKKVCSV